MTKIAGTLCIVVIVCAVALTYANSLQGVFIFDDYPQILHNPYIESWKNIPVIFSSGFGRIHITGANYYRPLLESSYIVDYFLWAHEKTGYHLTNIIFHALSAVILFLLVSRLFKDAKTSFLTALLFAVHPVYTSGVAYISGRGDSMVILFILLSLFFYAKYMDSPKNDLGLLFSSCLSFFMALLTKEISIFFIIFIILYRFYWRALPDVRDMKPKRRATYAAFSMIILLYIMMRANALKDIFTAQYNVVTASAIHIRILTMIKVFAAYLGILALPIGLHFERTIPPATSLFDPGVLFSAVILIAALYIFIKCRKEKDAVFYGLSWYFISFIPISNIFLPLNAFIAENWIQIPAIGLFLAVAAFAGKSPNRLAMPLLLGAAIFYSFLTMERNKEYSDPVLFYKSALRYEPKAAKLHNNLGAELESRKEMKGAIEAYEKALEINPEHATSLNNLANIYSAQGEHDKAVSLYIRALEIYKDNCQYLNNLGVAYIRKGDRKNALYYWRKSLSITPGQPIIKEYIERNRP